ncbi:hypothetical protein CORAM0001_1093 [Corynebacterium amycolatum SK46]|nr:hypothetical protein CORAM0001_1093 [Corynebacterium amycolatum SK46]
MKVPCNQRVSGMRWRTTRGVTVAAMVSVSALGLAACGGGNTAAPTTESKTSSSAEPVIMLPTRAELNDVLARLINPDLPIEEKALTIEDGDTAGDFFDIVTHSVNEQEISFDVIDPVTPGFTTKQAVAGVNILRPEEDPMLVDQVDFIYRDGRWMLSKEWACNLASTLDPEHKPGFCLAPGETPPPPPEPEEEAPVEEAPVEEAPAPVEEPAPAPAPEPPAEEVPPPAPEPPAEEVPPPPAPAPAPAPAEDAPPPPPPA